MRLTLTQVSGVGWGARPFSLRGSCRWGQAPAPQAQCSLLLFLYTLKAQNSSVCPPRRDASVVSTFSRLLVLLR